METKTALAGAALAAALAIGTFVAVDQKADPEAKDVKALSDAKRDGEVQPYAVYKVDRSDGGKVYAAVSRVDGGEKTVFVDHSPCAMRPAKVDPATCFALLTDGGAADPGDENVMQDGRWLGVGCVETPCVVLFGETAP